MWMATVWRSNAVVCVTVPYHKILFSILYFLTSQSDVHVGIALVYIRNRVGYVFYRLVFREIIVHF